MGRALGTFATKVRHQKKEVQKPVRTLGSLLLIAPSPPQPEVYPLETRTWACPGRGLAVWGLHKVSSTNTRAQPVTQDSRRLFSGWPRDKDFKWLSVEFTSVSMLITFQEACQLPEALVSSLGSSLAIRSQASPAFWGKAPIWLIETKRSKGRKYKKTKELSSKSLSKNRYENKKEQQDDIQGSWNSDHDGWGDFTAVIVCGCEDSACDIVLSDRSCHNRLTCFILISLFPSYNSCDILKL